MADYSGSGSEGTASEKSQSDHGSSEKSENADFGTVPDGFTALTAPDGKEYLMPSFLNDATCFAYHRVNERNGIMPDTAAGGVSQDMLAAFVSNHRHLS
jgi:hypothetical protein